MPEVTPLLRRGLTAVSAVLLFIGVIGVAAGDDSEKKGNLATGDGPTTTSLGGDGGDGGDDNTGSNSGTTLPGGGSTIKAPATTSKPGSSGTTAAPPVTTPATSDPGVARPPALGTYRYSFTITDANGTRASEHGAKVEAGENSPGVTRRVTTRKEESSTLKTTDAWAADGVRQERINFSASSDGQSAEIDCDWQPDVLVYAQPLAVGAKWTVDSSCNTTVQNQPVTLREQGERRVTGRAITSVGGTQVNVWVIETEGKLTVSSGDTLVRTDEVKAVTHFEPTRGLEVYDKTTTKSTGFGGGGDTTAERRLISLNPS